MPESTPKFYLTTPIYYVNARPHIGHAYSTIAADVIARRHRLLGDDTFFLTGTDEHGQKVQRSAAAAGIPPQQFADEVSATFRDLWKRMGITNDDYIRTTDPRHKRGVQKLWRDLEARGAIYLSTYTGQYSVGEEMFVDGPPGTLGPDGKPTETVTEENYFFRLSEYQERLLDLIESDTLHIQPESVRNEVLSFVRGGLKDLSISRTTFDWGIPVPGNPKHVIYVWLDALANYMTAVGYGSDDPADQARFAKYWPADLHLVGKEITRFHCVYWPAFLMAAGLPLPKAVVANGWLLFEESKMSKSRGNVVRTETILDAFGPLCPPVPAREQVTGDSLLPALKETHCSPSTDTPAEAVALTAESLPVPPTKAEQDLFASDVIRYFLLREIPFGQDGSFSFDALITRYNADLANGYGNLVSRTLNLLSQNHNAQIPKVSTDVRVESTLDASIARVTQRGILKEPVVNDSYVKATMKLTDQNINKLWGSLDLFRLAEYLNVVIGATDAFISAKAPWRLAKQKDSLSQRQLADTLYTAAESIRIITALLYPILPYATASVWRQLGLGDIEKAARNGELKNLQWGGLQPGTKLGPLAPIFPRADKRLAQIMTDMESANTPPKPTPAEPSPLTDDFSDVEPLTTHEPAPPEPAPSDPNAGPRTATLPLDNPVATVGGSHALSTERTGTPSHTEAQASGVFAAESPKPDTPQITIDDFVKIDLRVAQIVVAERIPKADKLLRLEVDLGYERRQILSGIAEWYTPEELLGRRIAVIANLAPRKMRGLESHGMLLAASGDDHSSKPILAAFSDEVPLGSRIR